MKHIKSISIKNIKAYGEKVIFNMWLPDWVKEWSWLNIIVWANNAWKSTIITAIDKLQEGSKIEKSEKRNHELPIEIIIHNNLEEKTSITNPGLGWFIDISNKNIEHQNFLIVKSRRNWKFKFNAKNNLDNYLRMWKHIDLSWVDDYFGWFLGEIFQDTSKKQKLTNFMKKIIPSFNDWKVQYDYWSDYIEYITWKEQIVHHAWLLSDWVNNLFKIGAFITNIWNSNQGILIIDEPELSLQPSSQKALFKELLKASKDKQIIIITHSPRFVDVDIVHNWWKIFRVNQKADGNVVNHELTLWTIQDLWWTLIRWNRPFIFDLVAKEIFFENNILFVEWQEDIGLIRKFSREKNIDLNFELFWYGSDWAGNIKKFLQVATDLWIKAWALFDWDKSTDYNECKRIFSEYEDWIKILSKNDIRDKYYQESLKSDTEENEKEREWIKEEYILIKNMKPSKEISTEWIFNEDGNIKKENEKEMIDLIEELNTYFENK